MFVAGDDKGKMAYSTDGITWTAVSDSTFGTNKIDAIAFGNDTFVAVSLRRNKVATSPDGVNWELVETNELLYGFQKIAFGNGKFVAGYRHIAASPDGINWTDRNRLFGAGDPAMDALKGGYVNAIAYGNGKFVTGNGAVSGISDSTIAYSLDGLTWTNVTTTAFDDIDYSGKPDKNSIEFIAYGNGKFVAGSFLKMGYSTDGITWKPLDIYGFGAIAYGGDKFIAGQGDGTIAYSPDGVTWIKEEGYVFGGYGDSINAIVYGEGKFVAAGNKGKMAYSTGK